MGSSHVLTDGNSLIQIQFNMKKIKITSDEKQKSIINDAIQSSENKQLDLYQTIFGGSGFNCNVAIDRIGMESSYDKDVVGTFLKALI